MPPKKRNADNQQPLAQEQPKDDNSKKCKTEPKIMVELNIEEHMYITQLQEEERTSFFEKLIKINSADSSKIPIRFKIIQSNIPQEIKRDIFKKITVDASSKYESWVQTILSIPFTTSTQQQMKTTPKKLQAAVTNAKTKMDKALVGHEQAKDEILRILYQWIVNPSSHKTPVGLEGPAGIGKTTFAQNALAVLKKPIVFISLSGALDASYLVGHSYTYEGAMCGRIIDALKEAKCMDPIIYLDELDKISNTPRGVEIVNTLIHIIDPTQNHKFRDKYIGFDIDLSKVVFIFSYNNPSKVCPILLDRIQRIQCEPPTIQQKIQIAREHLMPRCAKKMNVKTYHNISDNILEYIINKYTDNELGVRMLERNLNKILGCINIWKLSPNVLSVQNQSVEDEITEKSIDIILQNNNHKHNQSLFSMYT